MSTTDRTQARTDCTMADLEKWCAAVEVEVGPHDAFHVTRIDRTYPPCLGCGRPVFDNPSGNALLIQSDRKMVTSATFWPCGCILSVSDASQGRRP